MSSKMNHNLSIHADFPPCRYEVDELRHLLTKNSKKIPVLVKSLLNSNFKRFRDTAIRENFQLKLKKQMKKTLYKNKGNYIHQNKEVKRNVVASSLYLCLNNIEHEVKNMYASQKVQVSSSFAGQKQTSGTRRATNRQVYY